MHDIRLIRDNPAAFDDALARRGLAARAGDVLALDERWRELTQSLQLALAARNDWVTTCLRSAGFATTSPSDV